MDVEICVVVIFWLGPIRKKILAASNRGMAVCTHFGFLHNEYKTNSRYLLFELEI